MRKSFYLVLVLVLAAVFFYCGAVSAKTKVTVKELLTRPSNYYGKVITVRGKVTRIEQRVTKSGTSYFEFLLFSKGSGVTVFVFGQAQVVDGDRVTVTGRFMQTKKIDRHRMYNLINATPGRGSFGRITKV